MKKWEELLNRRQFVSLSTASGLAVLLGACAGKQTVTSTESAPVTESPDDFLKYHSPIDRTKGDKAPETFTGDQFERPHGILWDLPNYFSTHKTEGGVEEVPLVIIGGGASGLFSTYSLRKHKPVLLEQAARFGGNAKGESWRGMDYALGSAYIDEPTPGTPMHDYFNELNLMDFLVPRASSDPVEYKGKLYNNFWEGETDPKEAHKYKKISKFFSDVCDQKERAFPLIPSLNSKQMDSVKYYDKFDLLELLTKVAGGKLPHRLEAAFEYYCWSTYAGCMKELSSGATLNFLAQESRPIYVPPGGNARIAERLLQRIIKEVPAQNLRPKCVVVQVKVENNFVHVLYEDFEGKLRQIKAKAAIMSCPKFIASKILTGIEPERQKAIAKLKYRSYMTANLLVNKRVKGNYYDLFMVGKDNLDFSDIKKAQAERNATDFVLANFASPSDKHSVLTFYRAFPCDGIRQELIQPDSHGTYKKLFEKQITDEILPLIDAKESDIVDLRLTRWGHALPLCEKGIYTDGTIDRLRMPFKDKVFFVEQDSWAYPSFQTGATEIALIKKDVEKALQS